MTEDINSFTFDFAKEVQILTKEIGPKAANMLFANVEVVTHGLAPDIDYKDLIAGANVTEQFKRTANVEALLQLLWHPSGSSFALQPDATTELGAVVLNKNTFTKNFFGPQYAALSSLRTLYHEAGHVLLPGGDKGDALHPYSEAAGDAYAALKLLQRFGNEAIPFISMTSWIRSLNTLAGDSEHFTTPVLDKIIANAQSGRRDFTKCGNDEIVKLARDYAEQWTPSAEAINETRPFLWNEHNKPKKLRQLFASTILSSYSNGLAFLIAAKVVQPFLKTGMIYAGKHRYFTKKTRAAYQSAIDARLDGMKIDGLFNNASERPPVTPAAVARALPVILPRNRKTLVFNPQG